MSYSCEDTLRRDEVRRLAAEGGDTALNGLDYLEVLDAGAPAPAPGEQSLRQRILLVHFVHDRHLAGLEPGHFRIEGGERVRGIVVEAVSHRAADPANVLELRLDRYGDFSVYTLRLVQSPALDAPPEGFDPVLGALDFSFKVECPTELDCESTHACAPQLLAEPQIDYLAKDYASFRRLMLDRMAALLPAWRDRNAADPGIALVETLAYIGDHLSYQQDAIATEAYLGTARRRVSVRRHARLVDYLMHDGCNSRAWIHARVSTATAPLAARTILFAGLPQLPSRIDTASQPDVRLLTEEAVSFETMTNAVLFQAHNELRFYTWSDRGCCLAAGATRATLIDDEDAQKRARLRAGDVLIFVEKLGPQTGDAADADHGHRHAVRLTKVAPAAEPIFERDREIGRTPGPLQRDPLTNQPIVEIEWDPLDALPFPLCVSSRTKATLHEDVSVALGNIIACDQGAWVEPESLGAVPAARPSFAPRFNPALSNGPLTCAAPYDASAPAANAMMFGAQGAVPAISLRSAEDAQFVDWSVQRDLLKAPAESPAFVVEIEDDGTARLRFGDGRRGRRAQPGAAFTASYRVGNGIRGNVGGEAITHIVTDQKAITAVTNPLPAVGGAEPETITEVRQRAPYAYRTQQRAVTEQDYADLAGHEPGVQRAAATFRWTGSWHTAFVTVDRQAGPTVDQAFAKKIRERLERYRLIGQDLEVDSPRFVPLEIEMHLCVKPDYFRSSVRAALMETFSARTLPDGRRGVFHPDNFSFGQTVYLSPLYAAAQGVEGVASVHITTFRRLGVPDPAPLRDGRLVFGRLEIARLDSDANFPERGVFRFNLGGGK